MYSHVTKAWRLLTSLGVISVRSSVQSSIVIFVTGSVKMIRFSYSDEDTKNEEGREGWRPEMPLSRCYAPSPQPR